MELVKMKDEYIYRFYDEVKQNLDGDYKIILEPTRKIKEDWIEYDKVKWFFTYRNYSIVR